MANKTAEKISPDAFLNEMNAINDKAKDAVIDLLNKQGDGKHLVNNNQKDNGFVKDFETKLASHSLLVSEVAKFIKDDKNPYYDAEFAKTNTFAQLFGMDGDMIRLSRWALIC